MFRVFQTHFSNECLCYHDNSLQEAEKLEPDIHTTYPYIDYSEKRSLPVSVPEYHFVDRNGERFVVSMRKSV